jgi:hypothetical protein
VISSSPYVINALGLQGDIKVQDSLKGEIDISDLASSARYWYEAAADAHTRDILLTYFSGMHGFYRATADETSDAQDEESRFISDNFRQIGHIDLRQIGNSQPHQARVYARSDIASKLVQGEEDPSVDVDVLLDRIKSIPEYLESIRTTQTGFHISNEVTVTGCSVGQNQIDTGILGKHTNHADWFPHF